MIIGVPLQLRLNCSARGVLKLSWIAEDGRNMSTWRVSGDNETSVTITATIDVRSDNREIVGAYKCLATTSYSQRAVETVPLLVTIPPIERLAVQRDPEQQVILMPPLILQCRNVSYNSVSVPIDFNPSFYKRKQCVTDGLVVNHRCLDLTPDSYSDDLYLLTVNARTARGTSSANHDFADNHCQVKLGLNNILLVGLLQQIATKTTSDATRATIARSGHTMALDNALSAVICKFESRFNNVSVDEILRHPLLSVVAESDPSMGVVVRLLKIIPFYEGHWNCTYEWRQKDDIRLQYLNSDAVLFLSKYMKSCFKYVGESARFECRPDTVYPPMSSFIQIVVQDFRGFSYDLTHSIGFKEEPKNVVVVKNLTKRQQALFGCRPNGKQLDLESRISRLGAELYVIDAPLVNLSGGDDGNFTISLEHLSTESQIIRFWCNYSVDSQIEEVTVSWVLPNRAWPAGEGDSDPDYGLLNVEMYRLTQQSALVIEINHNNFMEVAGAYRCRIEYVVRELYGEPDVALSNQGFVTTILVTQLSVWQKFSSEWWWWLTLAGAALIIVVVVIAVVKVYPRRRRLSMASVEKLSASLAFATVAANAAPSTGAAKDAGAPPTANTESSGDGRSGGGSGGEGNAPDVKDTESKNKTAAADVQAARSADADGPSTEVDALPRKSTRKNSTPIRSPTGSSVRGKTERRMSKDAASGRRLASASSQRPSSRRTPPAGGRRSPLER